MTKFLVGGSSIRQSLVIYHLSIARLLARHAVPFSRSVIGCENKTNERGYGWMAVAA